MVDPQSFLPLQPHVFQILISISDCPKHGYTIIKHIGDRTDGEMILGTSTLYSTIKRLLASGLIEETGRPAGEESADSRRRYYGITGLGLDVARAEAARIGRLGAQAARAGLMPDTASGGSHGS